MIPGLGLWLVSYLIGAIPFGYLVARARGVNIFEHGSGNIGATNVFRVLGWRWGVFVFVLDFAKGATPVTLALLLGPHLLDSSSWENWSGWLEVCAGLAAFLGHVFPIYLGFRGGKGVATGAGAVAVLLPLPFLGALVTWAVLVAAFRVISLASVAAAVVLCFLHLTQAGGINVTEPRTLFSLLAATLVLVRHHGNLRRLWQGTEPSVGNHPFLFNLAKSLHVLALGLWFGASVFFTLVVAPSLFSAFEREGQKNTRPIWFPLPDHFVQSRPDVDGPREQGSRAAGFAVSPLFTWFFLVQGVCGFVALGTALPWSTLGKRHRWRVHLLFLALLTVIVGWPIERHVADLRSPRHAAVDRYLRADPSQAPQALEDMKSAKGAFARWHLVSLLLNFVTLGSVTVAMALTAQLPVADRPSPIAPSARDEESTELAT